MMQAFTGQGGFNERNTISFRDYSVMANKPLVLKLKEPQSQEPLYLQLIVINNPQVASDISDIATQTLKLVYSTSDDINSEDKRVSTPIIRMDEVGEFYRKGPIGAVLVGKYKQNKEGYDIQINQALLAE